MNILYIIFGIYFLLGLNLGVNYVSTLFQLLKTEKISFFEKELSLTITNIDGNFGVLVSSLFGLFFDYVF